MLTRGDAVDPATPLGDDEFAACMALLPPFERRPFIAIAVSGGPDSLALALLADRWARHRGGRIVALTVDHGLRPESADEARRVADWLAGRGIAHATLTWRPTAIVGNRQAAARTARYDLLAGWCKAAGCLHLMTAHHRDDQGETLLLRLARGSGLDGLAGVPSVRELAACRILRPLLAVPRARLAAVLAREAQPWIEDPSNDSAHYARVRLRRSAVLLASEGLGSARLAATARRLGRARTALEAAVAETLSRAVAMHPGGFALFDAGCLAPLGPEIGLRALSRLVAAVGGAEFPPRLERLERLHASLRAGLPSARTLGGCRLVPWRGRVLVCREPAAVAGALPLVPGTTVCWDGRFAVSLAAGASDGLTVGALADEMPSEARRAALPIAGAARKAFPAIRDLVGIVAIPHLHYRRPGSEASAVTLSFRPRRLLTSPGFTDV
ncbi:MAG: tRNA lysidine(34) synthetase TilS [Rhodospirillales bacterium]|nr:tRNA lysidine(34) synthetase TilS [Rhodospirillales bacterium]